MTTRLFSLADRIADLDMAFLLDLCDRIAVDDGVRLREIILGGESLEAFENRMHPKIHFETLQPFADHGPKT